MWNNMVDKYNSLSKKDNKRQCKKKKKQLSHIWKQIIFPIFGREVNLNKQIS